MENIDAVLERAEQIQKALHKNIDAIRATERGKKIKYDTLKDAYLYMKIAELELKVEQLQSK